MAWWEGAGAVRLAHDKTIVAEVQPGLRHEAQTDGSMAIVGEFLVTTRSGAEHRIPTTIKCPVHYPDHEPTAHEPTGMFKHEPNRHFYENSDQCCLWLDVESLWKPEDPDALRVFLDQLLTFYHRQLMVEAGVVDVFPGPQRGHGGFGYLDYLKEAWAIDEVMLRRMRFALAARQEPKGACPCGSGQQYRRCHQGAVTRFRQKANPFTLGQLISILNGMPRGGAAASRASAVVQRSATPARS